MILVFGGTTEGRKAVEMLEEAGSPYFYSTRGNEQPVEMLNGIRLNGSMDKVQVMAFCKENDIRLIVDAAHPFAEELHHNLLDVASETSLPIIRFDRIYPPHNDDLVWCKDFADAVNQLEKHRVKRLLALTGVNTIAKLRDFWMHHDCWFRILNRAVSKKIASNNQFPEERLVYYEEDDTSALIHDLQPDAIITKESGMSGGFLEKVEAAQKAGIKVFVVERPPIFSPPSSLLSPPSSLLPSLIIVNGPYGLRRAVEHLLPKFYPLHSGLTTGTCATAAAVAATLQMISASPLVGHASQRDRLVGHASQRDGLPDYVPVILPNGETIHVAVTYGDGYAACFKEAGDDPDVTNGIEIRAKVEPSSHFEICGGKGVGRFTVPGFDFPPGEAAINKAPREMIKQNILHLVSRTSYPVPRTPYLPPLKITISVPQGEEIARRTFNPRLGIEGGISIIGVSGIVKPFSEEAFIDSIRKCMEVAKASGTNRVVINSGAKSEGFLKAAYPTLPAQAFVQYGNYIGETLKMADKLDIQHVTLGIMLGKAVKLAAGQLDTHSRQATMDKGFVNRLLKETGISLDISGITLARELWKSVPPKSLEAFAKIVIAHCADHCRPLLPSGTLSILLIDDDGNIYQQT